MFGQKLDTFSANRADQFFLFRVNPCFWSTIRHFFRQSYGADFLVLRLNIHVLGPKVDTFSALARTRFFRFSSLNTVDIILIVWYRDILYFPLKPLFELQPKSVSMISTVHVYGQTFDTFPVTWADPIYKTTHDLRVLSLLNRKFSPSRRKVACLPLKVLRDSSQYLLVPMRTQFTSR